MADNRSHMTLCSHASNAESEGNISGVATTSAVVELEQSGPDIPRNPFVYASDLSLHSAGMLPHENEVLGNDSDGAAAQASNSSILNRAAVDGDNLLATPTHDVVQQGNGFDFDNGPFGYPAGNNVVLLNPFDVPHAAQAEGAGGVGDENEFNELPEEEEDSDAEDYSQFTAADVLNHLYEYKSAYRSVR